MGMLYIIPLLVKFSIVVSMRFYEFDTSITDADIIGYECLMEKCGIDPNLLLVESTDPGVIEFQNFIAKYQKYKIETINPIIGSSYVPLEIIGLILPNSKQMVVISSDVEYELVKISSNRLLFQRPDLTTTTYPRASTGWNKPMYLFNSIKDKEKFISAMNLVLTDWHIDLQKN